MICVLRLACELCREPEFFYFRYYLTCPARMNTTLETPAFAHLAAQTMREQLFCFSTGSEFLRHLLAHASSTAFSSEYLRQFKQSWNCLVDDDYVKSFTKRQRRIAKYVHCSEGLVLSLDNTVSTSTRYNTISGGQVRTYPYAEVQFLHNPIFQAILDCDIACASAYLGTIDLKISCQIFRLIAREDGTPTPITVGKHKDETEWVALHFIDAQNIVGAETYLYDNEMVFLPGSDIVLSSFLDTLYFDDTKIFHETTAIAQKEAKQFAARDVLIITAEAQ